MALTNNAQYAAPHFTRETEKFIAGLRDTCQTAAEETLLNHAIHSTLTRIGFKRALWTPFFYEIPGYLVTDSAYFDEDVDTSDVEHPGMVNVISDIVYMSENEAPHGEWRIVYRESGRAFVQVEDTEDENGRYGENFAMGIFAEEMGMFNSVITLTEFEPVFKKYSRR